MLVKTRHLELCKFGSKKGKKKKKKTILDDAFTVFLNINWQKLLYYEDFVVEEVAWIEGEVKMVRQWCAVILFSSDDACKVGGGC